MGADTLIEYFKVFGLQFIDDREKTGRVYLVESYASKIAVRRLKKSGLVFHYKYSVGSGDTIESKHKWWIEVQTDLIIEENRNTEIETRTSNSATEKVVENTSPVCDSQIKKADANNHEVQTINKDDALNYSSNKGVDGVDNVDNESEILDRKSVV